MEHAYKSEHKSKPPKIFKQFNEENSKREEESSNGFKNKKYVQKIKQNNDYQNVPEINFSTNKMINQKSTEKYQMSEKKKQQIQIDQHQKYQCKTSRESSFKLLSPYDKIKQIQTKLQLEFSKKLMILEKQNQIQQLNNVSPDEQRIFVQEEIYNGFLVKLIEDDLIGQILNDFDSVQSDFTNIFHQIIVELSKISDQIYDFQVENIKKYLKKQKNYYFSLFSDISLMEPLITKVLVSCYDFILQEKRDYIKNLNPSQLQILCDILIETLNCQNKKALEVFTLISLSIKEQQKINSDVKQLDQTYETANLVGYRSTNDEYYRESCIRLISQICFENSPLVPDQTVQNIYQYISKIAFNSEQQINQKYEKEENQAQKNDQSKLKKNNIFYKTLRACFNCIANLLAQEEQSTFIRQQNPMIFKLLKTEFEYMMSKIQLHHRSKRFISQMTTVLRALQFSLNLGTFSNIKLQQSLTSQASNEGMQTFSNPIKQAPGSGQNILYKQSKEKYLEENQNKQNQSELQIESNKDLSGEIKLPDNDAVSLFLNFYKLLFLGSKFASKMLKIELQEKNSQNIITNIQLESAQEDEDEEFKLMMDTSEGQGGQSSDYYISKEVGYNQIDELDPYQKIKVHSNLSIRNLLKNNSKILMNYWYIIFPSFMIKQQNEFTKYIQINEQQNTGKLKEELIKNIFEFIESKEPTLFFIIRHQSTQSQLRTSLFMTFQALIDNQLISKQVNELEKYDNDEKIQNHKTYFQFSDFLGQFIRFSHYILIGFMNEYIKSANVYPPSQQSDQNENKKGGPRISNKNQIDYDQQNQLDQNNQNKQYFDRQTYIQIIKTIRTLIQVTPYHLMRKGLSTQILQSLIENIQKLEKIGNRDQLLRNEIFLAINQAMTKSEITAELKQSIFQSDKKSQMIDILLNTLFKVHNFISNEKILILQTIGKNYSDILTQQWLKIEKGYQIPKIQNFIMQTLQKIDRKKVNLILKILEDWLKNYQIVNQVDNNDEQVLRSEMSQNKKKESSKGQLQQLNATPYDSNIFCLFLYDTINQFMFKQIDYKKKDLLKFSANKSVQKKQYSVQQPNEQILPNLNLEINTTISILNIICIMNQEQYHKIFKTEEQTLKLIGFLQEILDYSIQQQKQQQQGKFQSNQIPIPSILKAAIIKTFGYLIQHSKESSLFAQDDFVCNNILGYCLSPHFLNENNINVQIRNSWTISFICSLYPIERIIQSKNLNELCGQIVSDQQIYYHQVNQGQSFEMEESKQINQKDALNQLPNQSQFNPNSANLQFQPWIPQQLENEQESQSFAQIQNGQNFQLLINACIKYSQYTASNKEKVAASSIRTLGFIVQNLIQLNYKYYQQSDNNNNLQQADKTLSKQQIEIFIRQIIDVIISKLYCQKQCTPKVIWNICVAISKIIDTFNSINSISIDNLNDNFNYESSYLSRIFCFQTTQQFLNIFMEGQNYKTKIHACQTLLKYINLNQYGFLDNQKNPENLLKLFWTHIQEQLKFQINQFRATTSQSTFQQNQNKSAQQSSAIEQAAYIEQIDQSFIDFWAHICKLTSKNLSDPCNKQEINLKFTSDGSQHQSIMISYFNENAYDLLLNIIIYLRRELKVPEYNQIFQEDQEFTKSDFDQETQNIFKENPNLFDKLQKIQTNIIGKIFEIINNQGSEVRVSFYVYESFQKLAVSNIIEEYRSLEILRQGRSFDPRQ